MHATCIDVEVTPKFTWISAIPCVNINKYLFFIPVPEARIIYTSGESGISEKNINVSSLVR
jgi:hypothetical protein